MIKACSYSLLDEFMQYYDDEFKWDFEGDIINSLIDLNVPLPLYSVDDLIGYLSFIMGDGIYLVRFDDDDEADDTDEVSEIHDKSEIGDFVVYDGHHSDFMTITPLPEYSLLSTILAYKKEDECIEEE